MTWSAMPLTRVRKRCFVQMGGYEPVAPARAHYRFVRELARFQKTWNVAAAVAPPVVSADGHVASWTVDASAPNWQVTTDFHYFCWDDMVAADMAESDWWRFPLGIAALMEFVLNGTIIKYFVVAWRYGFFFLYPLVAILGMMWASISITRFSVIHLGLPYPLYVAPVVAFAVFVALRWTFLRAIYIRYALDDWYFARDLIHRVRPELEARLDRFAQELVRLARATDADEIVVDGHSLGAPLSLVVVDRALALDPELGRRGKPIHIVSSGSSLCKVALHPAAGWLRETVGRLANSPDIYWVEYQALVDVINAYKVDPVVALGMRPTGKPIIKIIRIRSMVEEHTYRRFHLNFLRVHRQAVMGNERRYYYDYFMLICGPMTLPERVEDAHRAVSAFAPDGSLLDGAAPAPAAAAGATP